MRYLVTGAAGFIGSTLVDRLLEEGHRVVGIDCFRDYYDPAAKRRNLESALSSELFSLLELDLADGDYREVDRLLGDDRAVVYHLAAQAGVRKSWGEAFDVYLRDNVLATQKLLEWAAGRGGDAFRNIVAASSSSVYGVVRDLPMVEERTVPRPLSPYGVTKLAAENLARLYAREAGLPTVSLRLFTVYGPRQRPDMAFSRFIRAVLEGRPITVYGDGSQTRDFTFVRDVVTGLRLAEPITDGRAMNLGGGNRVELREALRAVEAACGRPATVEHLEVQAGDVPDTLASTELFRSATGWAPSTPLEEGLAAEVAWLRG